MNALKTIVLALVLAHVWSGNASAQESVTFLGETYSVAYKKVGEGHHSIVELVRQGEDLKGWNKLIGLHYFPLTKQTPKQAAIQVAVELKKRDPAARFEISEHPKTKEALVDFLTSAANSGVAEFNAFKYGRSPDGKGLVAVQYAERLVLGATDAEAVKGLRRKAIEAAAAYDLKTTEIWFRR